jgi:hypothetical protein
VSKQAIHLQGLIEELCKERNVVTMHCNNQRAEKLATNSVYHHRIKYIEIRYNCVGRLFRKNQIHVSYLPTEQMTADTFTKGLNGPKGNM